MGKTNASYFANNPSVGKVRLDTRVRVAATEVSPSQFNDARTVGKIDAEMLERVELVVGDTVVAVGSIQESGGETFFQVEELR
jgi:hypothetical protein